MLLLNILWTLAILHHGEAFKAGWGGLLPFTSTEASSAGTHYGITECALLRTSANYLKQVHGSSGLDSIASASDLCLNVKSDLEAINTEAKRLRISSKLRSAIYLISSSNVVVDLAEAPAEKSHFDSESFTDASALVKVRLDNTIQELKDDDLISARISFGQAMHTTQDFYSHSNWIELGKTEPNLFIGSGTILGKYAPKSMPTCKNCTDPSCTVTNILPNIISEEWLTSGYFGPYPWSYKPTGKCSHGGPLDLTRFIEASKYGINKDEEDADHGSLHLDAARVAYKATLASLKSIWNDVGDKTFGRFLGFDTTSLAIAIDTTGSMGPYIELVKQMAIQIVESTTGDDALIRPHKYILSPFNDPTTGPLTITDDPSVLINAISALTAFGGGDTPELYYQGVDAALSVSERDSYIYTFTDAPAKDYYLRNQVLNRAIELNMRAYSFYVVSSYYGRLKRQFFAIDDDLGRLDGSDAKDFATATGGFTIGIASGDANATAGYVLRRLEDRQTLLIRTLFEPTNFTFQVDHTMNILNIDITSTILLSGSIELTDPTGKQLQPKPVTASNYFQLYTIQNLTYGLWTLSSPYKTNHSIELSSDSSISCTTILSEREKREGSDDYVPFLGIPLVNQTDLVLLTTCNNLPTDIQNASVLLSNRLGTTITTLKPSTLFRNGFVTSLVIPEVDFRILTIIDLNNNTRIQRQATQIISPTLISIDITNEPYILIANQTVDITYTIYNRAKDTLNITLCVTDTLKLFNNSDQCLKSYIINNYNQVNDTLTVSNNLYKNLTNITSSTFTFSISSTIGNGTESQRITSYKSMTLYITQESYVETQIVTTQPTSTLTSISTSTATKQIFLIPICS